MDIIKAHKFSSHHRESILKSKKCGCFYCLHIFLPNEIQMWVDEDEKGIGQTAICPYCSIDSVIGDSIIDFNDNFLKEMKAHWF